MHHRPPIFRPNGDSRRETRFGTLATYSSPSAANAHPTGAERRQEERAAPKTHVAGQTGEGEKGAVSAGRRGERSQSHRQIQRWRQHCGGHRPTGGERPAAAGRGRGKGGGEGNRQIFYSLCFGIAITGTWQRRSFQKVNFSLL